MEPDHRQLKAKTVLQRIMFADKSGSSNGVTFDDTTIPKLKNLESGQVN